MLRYTGHWFVFYSLYLCTVYKRLISVGDLAPDLKADALRDDFNLEGLPQIISEVSVASTLFEPLEIITFVIFLVVQLKGEQAVVRFQSFPRRVVFMGPAATVVRFQRMLLTHNFTVLDLSVSLCHFAT